MKADRATVRHGSFNKVRVEEQITREGLPFMVAESRMGFERALRRISGLRGGRKSFFTKELQSLPGWAVYT